MHYVGLAYFTPERFEAMPPEERAALLAQCPALDEAMRRRINAAIEAGLSRRFLPEVP